MLTEASVQLPIETTLGPLFIGCVLGAGLWGAGTMQAYWYYTTFADDNFGLKVLVALAWLADTGQQVLDTQIVFRYSIQGYSAYYLTTIAVQSLFQALTAFLVQGYFAWRIYALNPSNIYVSSLISLLVIGKLGTALAYVVRSFPIHSFALASTRLYKLNLAAFMMDACTDIMLCSVLCWYLRKLKSGSFDHKSNRVLRRLFAYAVLTGGSTTVCAVLTCVLSLAMPETYIYGATALIISRLYVNCLLAGLNARKTLRDQAGAGSTLVEISTSVGITFGQHDDLTLSALPRTVSSYAKDEEECDSR